MVRTTIEGILLAAGESRRMGFPKPLLRIGGETFLRRTLHAMLSVVRGVVVVVGAHEARVRAEVPIEGRIRTVYNPDFRRGQLSSLRCALAAVPPDAHAVIVHLADHPLVMPSTFEAVARNHEATGAAIVIARHAGRRGHPVLFGRAVFDELMRAPDEKGARFVVDAHPERVVYAEVEDPGVMLDLDTPEDLAKAGLEPPPREGRM